MKKTRLFIVTMLCMGIALVSFGSAPEGYYNSLVGKKDKELKDAIYTLIRPHTRFSYNNLWTYFPKTDCKADNSSQVWDMYSDETYYFNGTSSVSGMNKEHSFPKSWWGGVTDDTCNAYTDLNHLYPSDASANTAKSNWPLGVVETASFDNGVCKVGTPASGQGGGAEKVFEPADQYKGDFARTYFYMATVYQDYTWASKYAWQVTNSSWKTLQDWSISLLLGWARGDSVSSKETTRNDVVYSLQGNRNPFIDHPELAEYIWGDKQGVVFTLDGDTTSGGGGGGGTQPDTTKKDTTIVPVITSNTYQLVKATSDLSVGDEFIVVGKKDTSYYAMNTVQNTNNRGSISITVNGEYATAETDTVGTASGTSAKALRLRLVNGTTSGTYGLKFNDGYLYAASSSANWMRTQTSQDANSDATISIASDGVATVTFQGSYTHNTLRYNNSTYNGYTNNLFSCYLASNSVLLNVYIYKKVPESSSVKLGDVNEDGNVDVADITCLVNKVLGNNPSPFNTTAADMNSDGSYDVTDITQLVDLILNQSN